MDDTFVIAVEALCECDCNIEGSQGNDYTSEYCDYHGKAHGNPKEESTSVLVMWTSEKEYSM